MKNYLKVKNWEEFQHYSNRTPPWIKLHNSLLDDYEFECLSDTAKGHLLCIWMLASRTDNKIHNDAAWIKKKIGASSTVDIKTLLDSGFLYVEQDASKMLPNEEQDAAQYVPPEEERRGEEKDKSLFFDSFWKNWMNCKKSIGLGSNYGVKADALKKWKSDIGSRKDFEIDNDKAIDFMITVYSEILESKNNNKKSIFYNYENMYPQKFIGARGWDNE